MTSMLIFAACSEGDDGSRSSATGGVLNIGTFNDVSLFNPFDNDAIEPYVILYQLYDSLFVLDEDGREVRPNLASESRVSADGLTYTFPIREGVVFHDGSPLTPEDVVFSLERVIASVENGSNFRAVKAVTEGPDHSVVVTMKRPDFSLPRTLAAIYASIVPKDFGAGGEEGFESKPIGTGPFKFVSRIEGSELTLEENEQYWGGAPRLDGVKFFVFNDPNAATLAFEGGEIDVLLEVPQESVQGIDAEPLFYSEPTRITMMVANSRKPQFTNLNVRRALSMAIDRQTLVDGAVGGYGVPATNYIPGSVLPSSPLTHPTGNYEYDPEAARSLLADTPYSDLSVEILYTTLDPAQRSVVAILKENLEAVGIDVKGLQGEEVGVYLDILSAEDSQWDLMVGWSEGNSATHYLALPLDTEWLYGGWSTAETTKAIEDYQAAPDPETQADVLSTWESFVQTELPTFPLYHSKIAFLVNEKTNGFSINPFQDAPLEEVTLEDS